MTYRDRRTARAARLDEWAAKREEKAEQRRQAGQQKADAIPLGQPILVGHHSESRDRNFRKRMSGDFEKAREHQDKANSMRSRADGIRDQLQTSIYSDDPDAIEQLQARIAELEAKRERIKKFNASARKAMRTGTTPDWSILTAEERADIKRVYELTPYNTVDGQFPKYALTNLGGNINRNKKRLAALIAEQEAQS